MANKLIYFGDPMCSWCYGFGPELRKILTTVNNLDFELILGGLRPFGTEKITDMKDFLTKHWTKIESKTGLKFGYDIFNDTSFVYDTEPSNRAVIVAKHLGVEDALSFYEDVQYAFYAENKNVLIKETFVELAAAHKLDPEQFALHFDSEKMKQKTRESFSYTIEQGINAFPTLVLISPEKNYLISRGYQKAENLIERINEILSLQEKV